MERKWCLFGGDRPWTPSDWIAADDTLRGGASHSALVPSPGGETVHFRGHLDTSTLGAAGFASQHTRGPLLLDLSGYDGLCVSVVAPDEGQTDGKRRYALTLRDEEEGDHAVSWEAGFVVDGVVDGDGAVDVKLPWGAFEAVYRGRRCEGRRLAVESIRRVGLMMRSYFGEQRGDFDIEIRVIAAERDAEI